jgi:hypothetical protein
MMHGQKNIKLNIHNHQHPSMATRFGPFLDHPQANIKCKRY